MDFINILTFVLTAYHIKCQSVGIIMLYLLVQHVVVRPSQYVVLYTQVTCIFI